MSAEAQSAPHRAKIYDNGVIKEVEAGDEKISFPPSDRNKDVILEQLNPILDEATLVLEVGSGTGQHIFHFSKAHPGVVFQPTEYDTALFRSINAYAADIPENPIKKPLELDATNSAHWQEVLEAGQKERNQELNDQGAYDLVITTNVFHITPWIVGQSIVRGAGKVLKAGGKFCLYGAFTRDGKFATESNREFDQTLRGRDPSWGVREINDIAAVAEKEAKMTLKTVVDMPSNNYMLIFQKVGFEE